ncbi:hypothetical protein CQJ94_11365 [Glycomyces fuscus]|nr:hypothetical protein CQJ94_11365 [Glycomyces fuscus]
MEHHQDPPKADGDLEARVVKIWSTAFGTDDVTPSANFTELGGTSLISLRLLTSVRREFGVRIPVDEFLRESTVARMCELIRERSPKE